MRANIVQCLQSGPEVDPTHLLSFLSDPDPRVRLSVIRRLSVSASQFVRPLIEVATRDPRWDLRTAVLQALLCCKGGPEEQAALEACQRDPDRYVREKAMEVSCRWRNR